MKSMKLWDWVVWNQRLKWKIIEYFMSSKKKYIFVCVCIKNKKNRQSRLKIDNCNIEIDGRNFYDQAINDSIKEYNEIRKI